MQYTLNTMRVLLVLEKKTCFKSRYFSPVLTSQFQSFICCGAGKEAQIAKKSFQSPSCLRSTWLGHTKEMMDRVGVKHHNMRIYFFLCQNVNNAERRNFFLIFKKVCIILPWSNCILERLEHFFFGHPKKKLANDPLAWSHFMPFLTLSTGF